MLKLDLQVYWLDAEQYSQQEAGVNIDLSDCVLRNHTFYNIDNIRDHLPNTCVIVSGGCEYIVNEPRESVKAKIKERLTFKIN